MRYISRNVNILIWIGIFSAFIPLELQAQINWKERTSISTGFSLAKADKRTDFLMSMDDVEFAKNKGRNWLETELFVNMNLSLVQRGRFNIIAGVGLLSNIHTVHYPINLRYFDVYYRITWRNNFYAKTSLYLPTSFIFYVLPDKKLSLVSSSNFCIAFHKWAHMKDQGNIDPFTKWTFEPTGFESFLGIGFEKKDVEYSLNVRVINIMFKDDALINIGKDIDFYNTIKIRLGVGFKI